MLAKPTAQILGIIVLVLAIAGLLAGEGRMLGNMNTDIALDILRIPVAALLLYVGFTRVSGELLRGALLFVGILYIAMGLIGWGSPILFGLLPSGLSGLDIAFHLIAGVIALTAGMRPAAVIVKT